MSGGVGERGLELQGCESGNRINPTSSRLLIGECNPMYALASDVVRLQDTG